MDDTVAYQEKQDKGQYSAREFVGHGQLTTDEGMVDN